MNDKLAINKNFSATAHIKQDDLEIKPIEPLTEEVVIKHEDDDIINLPNPEEQIFEMKKSNPIPIPKKKKKISERQRLHLEKMRKKSLAARKLKKDKKEALKLEKQKQKLLKKTSEIEKLQNSNKLLDKKKVVEKVKELNRDAMVVEEQKMLVQENPAKYGIKDKSQLNDFFSQMNQFLDVVNRINVMNQQNQMQFFNQNSHSSPQKVKFKPQSKVQVQKQKTIHAKPNTTYKQPTYRPYQVPRSQFPNPFGL